jgi:hypothetical protein
MQVNPRPGQSDNVYEMLWDCEFCGTKKLLGKTHRFCPNCGAQQDPQARYFPSDSERVAVRDHVYVGVDQVCPACQTPNAARAQFCTNCGSPLEKAAAAALAPQRETGSGQSFGTESLKDRQQAQALPKPKAQAKGLPLALLLVVAALIAGVGFCLYTAFSVETTTVSVAGFRWERQISLEALQPVPASGSCDFVPLDAYALNRSYEVVGYTSVPDGQRCDRVQIDQGDGTFREENRCETVYRSEPVYGYVCSYLVNRWLPSRNLEAGGDKSAPVDWPPANPSVLRCDLLGCERPFSRSERYYLQFRDPNNEVVECPVERDLWEATGIERGFTAEFGTVFRDLRCSSLEPVSP